MDETYQKCDAMKIIEDLKKKNKVMPLLPSEKETLQACCQEILETYMRGNHEKSEGVIYVAQGRRCQLTFI